MDILLPAGFFVSVSIFLIGYVFHQRTTKSLLKKIQVKNAQLIANQSALKDAEAREKEVRQQIQEEQFSRKIISHVNQSIIYIDPDGILRFLNPFATNLLDDSIVSGKPYVETLNIELNGKRDYSLFESAFSGKLVQLPDYVELYSRRGKIPITGSLIPIPSATAKRAVVFIFTDNSDRVKKDTDQKVFFSQAAHELRTPLTVIRLTIGVLQKKFMTLPHEKIAEHLRRAEETSTHLVQLVNDFLNMSRLDMGRIEMVNTSFDMVSLTEEIIHELMPLFRERKLYIQHEKDGEYRSVIGDRMKTKEVMTNIISNSIKYTIQGGISITHTAAGNVLATKITDSGSGIPTEQQGMLFKRFMQVGGARQQSTAKSTGLGLYISKKFAQLMHGDVFLEYSEPGKGSTFTFTLPLG